MKFKITRASGTLSKEELENRVVKVGFDASILVDMARFYDFEEQLMGLKLVQDGNLCTSRQAYSETIGILKKKYGIPNARKILDTLLKTLDFDMLEDKTEDIGAAFGLLDDHKISHAHFEDMLILANFKRSGVSHLCSNDKLQIKTAKKEGFGTIKPLKLFP